MIAQHMYEFSPKELGVLIEHVFSNGEEVPSERGNTREFSPYSLHMRNPLDRIATESWRRFNVGFAITEALSYIVGDDSLQTLTQFVPGYANFSTNGRTIDGSYGKRIHTSEQLSCIIEMLKKTPETRRAVISIYMGAIDLLGGGGLNTPCTLSLHFLVRNDKLDMHVSMRSNDVYLGLTNDVFAFTLLQEWVSVQTGIALGRYYHHTSSLHIYESDFKRFEGISRDETVWTRVMSKMPQDFNPKRVYNLIRNLHDMSMIDLFEDIGDFSSYERDLFLSAALIAKRKSGARLKDAEFISDTTLRLVTSRWLNGDKK